MSEDLLSPADYNALARSGITWLDRLELRFASDDLDGTRALVAEIVTTSGSVGHARRLVLRCHGVRGLSIAQHSSPHTLEICIADIADRQWDRCRFAVSDESAQFLSLYCRSVECYVVAP